MPIMISGPGVGLPPPQNLYPSELYNAPYDSPTNYLTLNAGDEITIPAGRWLINPGAYSGLEFLDPVTGVWRAYPANPHSRQVVLSDGFTRRIANRLGCPVGAYINAGGSGFAAATAAITASTGGSLWTPIVGGSLSIVSITNAGSGYTMPPLVLIPAPGNPGIQATAYASLTSTSVTTVSLVNFGAGYASAPTPIVLLPNPTDPNFGSITNATITVGLANSGAITGALCTNPGAPLTSLTGLTLTAAGGAGSGASIVAVILQTVTGTSIVAGGVGMGSASAPALISSVGGTGTAAAASLRNPAIDFASYLPRAYVGSGTSNAGGTITALTTIDGGLFVSAPTAVVAPGAGGLAFSSTAVAPSITFTMGSTYDTVLLQPL